MRNLPKRILLQDTSRLLCRNCLSSQRRQFGSVSPPPSNSGLAHLANRQLLAIDGVDAVKFLQGLITGSITTKDGLARPDAFYTGFLNATGRVMHDVFVYPIRTSGNVDPTFYIESDASQIDRLAKYVKRHKLRAKVNIRKLDPDSANIWQAWDDSTGDRKIQIPEDSSSSTIISDPRAPGLGYRILQLGADTPPLELDQTTEQAYTIRRYLHGVPEGQDEILREQALPLETNMELMNGVDFHKGCYVGQELTIRTKHRGVVRKRILPLMVYEQDKAAPQTLKYEPEVATMDSPTSLTAESIPCETSIGRFEKKGRSAGKWLKGVGNIGLGLCRLEIMTDVTLPGEQASSNFSVEDEFALQWGGAEKENMVKVKAFVPEWLRAGLEGNSS